MTKSVNRIPETYSLLLETVMVGFVAGILYLLIAGWEYENKYLIFAILTTIATVPYVWYLYTVIQKKRWIRKRHERLFAYAAQNGISAQEFPGISKLSLSLESLGKRDERFNFCYGNEDLMYGEYTFAVYKKTKHGEYKSDTVYYAVCIAKLPRILPNLFFDAKSSKGKEFKRQFHRSQRHSLEGDFDTYFDSYFPTHYSLDSLSFITPEVMQAMIEAKDYDIEIANNKLFLYAVLKEMPDQIADMFNKSSLVRTKLLNNIVTYRDQRVEYADGRKMVSAAGFRLRRNLTNQYALLASGIVLLIMFIIFMVKSNFNFYLLFFGLSMSYGSYNSIRYERRQWERIDEANKIIS